VEQLAPAAHVNCLVMLPASSMHTCVTGAETQRPAASHQALPEVPQGAPSAARWMTPLAGAQESIVQGFPSSTGTGLCRTPRAGSHESAVQALPSSGLKGVPAQLPAASQRSLPVQAFPSLQLAPAFTVATHRHAAS
jgi:hypothetical protein